MKFNKKILTIFILILALSSCDNSKEKEDKDKKQGRINTILLLSYFQSYRSPIIEFDAVVGIAEVLRTAYNNNNSNNVVDVTVNCTSGGTMKVTGTLSTTSSITTVNLNYAMSACKFEQSYTVSSTTAITKLTITGTIAQTGTISTTQSYTKILKGSSLSINGTVENSRYPLNSPYKYESVTCDYSYTLVSGSTTGSTTSSSSGSICGKSY